MRSEQLEYPNDVPAVVSTCRTDSVFVVEAIEITTTVAVTACSVVVEELKEPFQAVPKNVSEQLTCETGETLGLRG